MMISNSHITDALVFVVALQTVCCCNKFEVHEPQTVIPEEISLSPTLQELTKDPISGTDMPAEYSIFLSAYVTQSDDASNLGNYFSALEFKMNGTSTEWKSSPVTYWPFASELDLLGFACDKSKFDLPAYVVYNDNNCAKGAIVSVRTPLKDTEVLYSSARKQKRTTTNNKVTMVFNHTQAWLHFTIKSSPTTQKFVIDYIHINNLYETGKIIVFQPDPINDLLMSEWSFTDIHPTTANVGSVAAAEATATFDYLVPAQQQKAIELKVRYSDGTAYSDEMIYTAASTESDWVAGKRYNYEITLTPHAIIMNPVTVEDWLAYNHMEQNL